MCEGGQRERNKIKKGAASAHTRARTHAQTAPLAKWHMHAHARRGSRSSEWHMHAQGVVAVVRGVCGARKPLNLHRVRARRSDRKAAKAAQ